MSAIDTNLVVLAVVTRWRIDAALFLLTSAGFLAWSIAENGAARSIVAFAIELAIGIVVERVISTLPGDERLADADPLPAGARDGSVLRYAVEGVVWMLLTSAVTAAVAFALGDSRLIGGWFAAWAIIRVTAAARARRIERRDRVQLRVGVGSWRRRTGAYYVMSPALWA
jgi:hypothetical protein